MQTAQTTNPNQNVSLPEKVMKTFYIDRQIAKQFTDVVKKDMRNQSLVIENSMRRFIQSKV